MASYEAKGESPMVARRAHDLRLAGYRRKLPSEYGDFQVGGGGPCGQIDDLILLPHPRQEIIDSLSAYYRGKQARKVHFYLEWIEGGMYVNTIVFLVDHLEDARDYVAAAVEANRKAEGKTWGVFKETYAEEWRPSLHPVSPEDVQFLNETEPDDAAPAGTIGRAFLDPDKLRAIEAASRPAAAEPPDQEWIRPSRFPRSQQPPTAQTEPPAEG
jgi:hypothetical protein